MLYYWWRNIDPTIGLKIKWKKCLQDVFANWILLTLHKKWTVTQTSPQFISAAECSNFNSFLQFLPDGKHCYVLRKHSSVSIKVLCCVCTIHQYLETKKSLLLGLHVLHGRIVRFSSWLYCHLCEIWLNVTGLLCSSVMSMYENSSSSILGCTMGENEMIISTASKSRSLVTARWNARRWAVQTICLNLTE